MTTPASFYTLMAGVPISTATAARWASQPAGVLDAIAAILQTHGANPWVFSDDAQYFWTFATTADVGAMYRMSHGQQAALLGDWQEQDHVPETFGYHFPQGMAA